MDKIDHEQCNCGHTSRHVCDRGNGYAHSCVVHNRIEPQPPGSTKQGTRHDGTFTNTQGWCQFNCIVSESRKFKEACQRSVHTATSNRRVVKHSCLRMQHGRFPSISHTEQACNQEKRVSIATQLRRRHFLSCPSRVFFGFSAIHVRSNSHACFVSCCLRTISLREIFEPDESHLFRPLTCFFLASILALSFLLPSRTHTQSCSTTTRRREIGRAHV